MPAWPLALAVLPAGFAVAELTDVRALGGVVLVAGGLATVRAARDATTGQKVAWGGVAFASFVVSHLLSDTLGAWGAVACVSAVTGAAGWLLLDGWGRSPTRLQTDSA